MKDAVSSVQSLFACPSCGTETVGHFCGDCGEKQVSDQDYSFDTTRKKSLPQSRFWNRKFFEVRGLS